MNDIEIVCGFRGISGDCEELEIRIPLVYIHTGNIKRIKSDLRFYEKKMARNKQKKNEREKGIVGLCMYICERGGS